MQKKITLPSSNDNSFTTDSGTTYIIHSSLTRKRFEVLEKLQVEFQHGVSLSGFKDEAAAAFDLLNKSKPADAAVKLNNLLNGVARIDAEQPHPLFLICALFVCPADEDRGKWNDADAAEKIKDWDSVDVDFFLGLAKRFVLRYTQGLHTGFQNFSDQQAGV